MNAGELFKVQAGSPQARIVVSKDEDASIYYYYTIDMLRDDLVGVKKKLDYSKMNQIRTMQHVETIRSGDLVISLIAATAAIASEQYDGFLITQNFVKLTPAPELDKRYLLFLLNEDNEIRSQLFANVIGTGVKKVAVQQLTNLKLVSIPPLKLQKQIGETYLNTKFLTGLRQQSIELKEQYAIEGLKRVSREYMK